MPKVKTGFTGSLFTGPAPAVTDKSAQRRAENFYIAFS